MKHTIPYTFARLQPIAYKDAKFLIFPIPYEGTVSFRRGTRFGPESIMLSSRYLELYDEETGAEPRNAGILTLPELPAETNSAPQMMKRIEREAAKHIANNKFLLSLGGEHSISFPLVKAHMKSMPDLKILHFDAHADMRDSYDGSRFSHACVTRRIADLGCEIYSFGIRSISRKEVESLKEIKNVHINYAFECRGEQLIEKAKELPKGTWYISIDIDCFDPAYVPDTGTPEPGGFSWYEITGFLKEFISKRKIAGADIVELAPQDHYNPSSFLAAKLAYKLLAYLTAK